MLRFSKVWTEVMNQQPKLRSFFEPEAIAVIGASRTPGKVGYDVVRNLHEGAFEGGVYPVNPKAEEILGLECYSSILDVPDDVELAVIVLPSKLVPDIVNQCGEKGIDSIIVISAGFKEVGEEGARLQEELKQRCNENDIRCIGPNCLGVISTPAGMNASFGETMPIAGDIAFISQSGALGTAVLDFSLGEEMGISRFVSYGNKADVDETDLLEALGDDEATNVILAYLEAVSDGQKFIQTAERVSRKKPVVVLKSGRTGAGAKAASSHTGSLAGSDAAYDAAFTQSGLIRATTAAQFLDLARAFSFQGAPSGNRVAVITNAGGPGILTTDAIEESELTMADLSQDTQDQLADCLPPQANIQNPIDVLGDAKADRYKWALEIVSKDPKVDSVIVVLTPQTSTESNATAEAVVELAHNTDRTVIASFMGGASVRQGVDILEKGNVPNFETPERGIETLEAMYSHHQWIAKEKPETPSFDFNEDAIQQAIDAAAERGMDSLGERYAQDILKAAGIPIPQSKLAPTPADAAACAERMGFPVVLKISSDDILHKSDAGGVKVGMQSAEEVKKAFAEIMDSAREYNPTAEIDGVLVQQMVQGGTEVIVGMSRDPQFGPMVMFGLGGIYVELLKDVSFRVAPITPADADAMVNEIRTSKMLKGFRGQPKGDLEALKDCLMRVAHLAQQFPQLSECDLNPLKVFPEGDGIMAVDVRFGLNQESA